METGRSIGDAILERVYAELHDPYHVDVASLIATFEEYRPRIDTREDLVQLEEDIDDLTSAYQTWSKGRIYPVIVDYEAVPVTFTAATVRVKHGVPEAEYSNCALLPSHGLRYTIPKVRNKTTNLEEH
ncbi:hypothetical protein [Roseibium sp.]|jgi:hypothetical protein|uniref:hypothetical protein n=1 Tax=Roseibium sp. TaxID=1936156 RepID=UPI003BAAF78F